ncbi:MAG: tRNA uridine(34) 5-carboxymethylaminomethyl modification radical SAM/GNAT enzyme Elp3, partial [Gammaproteobacteria bacterium]|nr:tRNA uridine(34) 5-carboxymethylaminomethyl modification radical SAM/GNAT enzyme Elp3 [Gammaproteobacteria bacterium]
VLTSCLRRTPRWCRLTRVVRDIPSPDIVVGNKRTNFREVAEAELRDRGVRLEEIRTREI